MWKFNLFPILNVWDGTTNSYINFNNILTNQTYVRKQLTYMYRCLLLENILKVKLQLCNYSTVQKIYTIPKIKDHLGEVLDFSIMIKLPNVNKPVDNVKTFGFS